MNRQQELDVLARRRAGLSIRAIARETGIPFTSIAAFLKRSGVAVPEQVTSVTGKPRTTVQRRYPGARTSTHRKAVAAAVAATQPGTVATWGLEGATDAQVEDVLFIAASELRLRARFSQRTEQAAVEALGLALASMKTLRLVDGQQISEVTRALGLGGDDGDGDVDPVVIADRPGYQDLEFT